MAVPATSVRLRVAALLTIDGAVVVVRHAKGHATYHLLPGGGVEAGEPIADALRREVKEETGLAIEMGRPVFVNDSISPDMARHMVQIAFLCSVVGGALTDHPEDPRVAAVELVPPERLDALDLRPPMAARIREALELGADQPATYLGPLWSEPSRGSADPNAHTPAGEGRTIGPDST